MMGRMVSMLILVLFAGCVQLQRENPQRDFFTLEAPRPERSTAAPRFGELRLEPLQVAPAYAGKLFVYRTGQLQYEEDYYNRFFAAPAQVITEAAARWLRAAGLFRTVYLRPAPVEPAWHLSGSVDALYGDFQAQPAKAVMEISFDLLHEGGNGDSTVLRRDYRREIPLQGTTAAALAAGWSEALAQILDEFEQDLRNLPVPN